MVKTSRVCLAHSLQPYDRRNGPRARPERATATAWQPASLQVNPLADRKNLFSLGQQTCATSAIRSVAHGKVLNQAGPQADNQRHSRKLHGPDCSILNLSWREKAESRLVIGELLLQGKNAWGSGGGLTSGCCSLVLRLATDFSISRYIRTPLRTGLSMPVFA